jgi:iron complex outermembrane receptor protein
MHKFTPRILSRSISLALLSAGVWSFAGGAMASGVEEVIVSARKTEENVQQVPTAITALTQQDLSDLKIANISQVGQTVPNLNIQNQFGSASAPQFYMRGVASGSLKFQIDSGVALYVDGVYLGRPAGTAFDLADIAGVEVLRGPQGSLFGRNSTGGAINMLTAAPTGEFGGHAEVGFGNYGSQRDKVTIDLPEYAGFATRLTYLHSELDGYARNRADQTYHLGPPFNRQGTADRFGMEKTDSFGAAVQYTGIDDLKVDYRFDYTDKASSQQAAQLIGITPAGLGAIGAVPSAVPSGSAVQGVPEGVQGGRESSYALDFTGESQLRIQGHSLSVEYAVNDSFSIKNILAHRSMDEDVGINDVDGGAYTLDGAPFGLLSSAQQRDQSQWSDELQFFGSTEQLDWIGGLFWFKEKGDDNNPVYIMSAYPQNSARYSVFGVPEYFAGSNGSVENTSKAAFAHVTWHTTDDLDLSAGLRYTKDERHEHVIAAGSVVDQSADVDFNNTDWDVSATYKINPDVNVYAKISTGYLSGGVINGNTFEPEKIKSYELGLKSQYFDNRLRLNLTGFYTEREHLQLLQFNDGSNTTLPAGTFLVDGGDSKQNGVELEVTAAPIDDLTLTANYGHVNDHIDNGLRPQSPKNNAYLAAQYTLLHLEGGSHVDFRIDGSWVDDHYQTACKVGDTATGDGCIAGPASPLADELDRAATSKASWLVGARLTLADVPLGDKTMGRVSLWGRNLTDSDEIEFSRDVGNAVIGTYQIPRTYGIDFSADF